MPTVRKIALPAKQSSSDQPSGFSELTLEMIRNWVGEKSFGRSRSYVGRSIFDTRRTGMTLKARCQGTDDQPYTVKATLDAHGIVSDDCSCPVGSHCKHVAALLQTWLNDPEAFIEVEALDQTLERRDKAELIEIIHRMVDRYPDLELMLELPTVVADKQGQPLDAKLMRQQINNIFHGADIETPARIWPPGWSHLLNSDANMARRAIGAARCMCIALSSRASQSITAS
jgi:hypothetical protein